MPIALMAVTYPVFQLTERLLGDAVGGQLAWFAGMSFYWFVWGGVFSCWVLGRARVWELIRPRRPTATLVALVAFLIAMAAAVRFLVPGMGYPDATTGALILLGISTLGNGVFEELLWRGVFFHVFPHRRWLRVMWPSVWFGLWHLVPGSIAAGGPQIAMVIGPVFMGLYLALLTKRTGSVWWAIVAHALGGLVMIS
jgi:membrane protease YdiL (CAAX protease family)